MMASPPSLDLKRDNRNRTCGRRIVTRAVTEDGKQYEVTMRLPCKKWRCIWCGPWLAEQLCRGIGRAAKANQLDRLLTLTLDPKKIKPGEDAYVLIRQLWAKFRVYLARQTGESIRFIAIMERHKNGLPHLHVLVSHYLRQAWISETWDRLGGGKIVHIERVVELDRVAYYLGKYLTKVGMMSLPSGVRRFTTSRGIKLREKGDASEWKARPESIDEAWLLAKERIVNEIRDERGRVRGFVAEAGLDSEQEAVTTDPLLLGILGLGFEVVGVREARDSDEDRRKLRESFQQGTIERGFLDTCPEAAA